MPEPIKSLSHRLALQAETSGHVHAITQLGPDGMPASTIDYETLWRRVNGLASRAWAIGVTAYAPRANDRSGRLQSIISIFRTSFGSTVDGLTVRVLS